MICVSVGACDFSSCLKIIKQLEFAEIRLDKMDLSLDEVKRLFSAHKNLIATFKGSEEDGEKRRKYLITAIEAGARYVDIEIDSPEEFKTEIKDVAKRKGCYSILSFHDFKETKSEKTLKRIVEKCLKEGADYAKIACKVNNDRDNLALLRLLYFEEIRGRTIVIGMGEKGKITRVMAPLLGSPFTFASFKEGMEMAEGQIEKSVLRDLLNLFEGKGL